MSRREVIALIFGLLNTPNVEWGPMQYKFAEALGRVRGAW